jgi:protocatechuate 3,4-dioxygenase beta subunit
MKQLAAKQERAIPEATPIKGPGDHFFRFSGRVLDPDGNPVQNARVFLLDDSAGNRSALQRARTDADGRFVFLEKSEVDRSNSTEPWNPTSVLAFAEGYAFGVPQVSLDKRPARDELTIQLTKDDVPIMGRVIDLQGKPVAGVQIRVRGIQFPKDGDMVAFIHALKVTKEGLHPQLALLTGFHDDKGGWNLDSIFPPATTDAAGRFCIRGVGGERLVDLLIEGPTIEMRYLYAMTRPCKRIEVPAHRVGGYMNPIQPVYTFFGATFDHIAAPSRPVAGLVRDRDTGKPIPGAIVEKYDGPPAPQPRLIDDRIRIQTVTDSQGHYRITGMPWGANFLRASGPAEIPYVMSVKEVLGQPGSEPVTVDFSLKRGVWIDVKVTDKMRSKPVPCRVQYFVFKDNPFVQQAIGFTTRSYEEGLAEDGSIRLAGLPGRGLIAVQALEEGYRHGVGTEGIQGKKGAAKGDEHFETVPLQCFPYHFHAVAEIAPAKDRESVNCSLVLDPGQALAGTILGPDNQPLGGVLTYGLYGSQFWSRQPLRTPEFLVKALEPGKSRRLLFLHQRTGFAGTLLLHGDEQGPLTVQLQPGGIVTGRLLDPTGQPRRDAQVLTFQGEILGTPHGVIRRPVELASLPDAVTPDKNGTFRMEGLVPGLKYNLDVVKDTGRGRRDASIVQDISVKSGEIKDLGEVRIELDKEGPGNPK